MRWFILEDALKNKWGHYFEYISTFKKELEASGDTVEIFCDNTAEPWLIDRLSAQPVLPKCIWRRMSDQAPRWKKLLRYPMHGWETFWAWASIFRRSEPSNVVFVPSVFTHHLMGIVPFLLFFGRRMRCTFLLFFPSTPICFDNKSGVPMLRPDPTAKIFPWLLRRLRRFADSGKVILGVETRAMCDALSSITGLPFTYFPHPVAFNSKQQAAEGRSERASNKSITFGAYGFARHEKGSDILQSAMKLVLERPVAANFNFSVQWTEDFPDGEGGMIVKDPALLQHPQVTYIEHYFDPEGGYESQLAKTDFMVLPYRDSYRYRLSRVVIEAMTSGIPVIVSPETTLEEQATEHGAAVVCQDLTPESVADAMIEAARNIDHLQRKAQDKSSQIARHFSVQQFRDVLLERMRTTGMQRTDRSPKGVA